ncbi:MAG: DUF362 domain-containing protein [Chloroflexi bacterium]|nr:DUF362 domain-containing protein [Chloroflexota bacterium]
MANESVHYGNGYSGEQDMKWRLSRRAFLRLGLLGGIAASARVIYQSTEAVGFERWFRWMLRGRAARFFAPPARVALAACPSYDADILAALRGAWQNAQMPDLRGLRVVLKPNLVDYLDGHPTFTHPRVVQAMIRLAREQGARQVTVAEGTTFRRDPQAILDATGFAEMLAQEQVEFVDLNYDDLVAIPLQGGYTNLKTLLVARTVAEADVLISMPKLKTHHWTMVSASIKNLFGIVPGIKYGWPKNTLHTRGIPAFLAELASSVPTRAAAVVDGIVGMEGDGPISGNAVSSGALVVGTDLLAVDATAARLMGFDPAQIDYLSFAAWAGVGASDESKIELVGEPLARLQRGYARPPTME